MRKAKNISNISKENMDKRLNDMLEPIQDVSNRKVCISKGNRKTGEAIHSVSLMPVLDCGNCSACKGKCYDLRNDCCYKNVRDSRKNNSAIFKLDPKRYFDEISIHCRTQEAFRWHVGGDIKNMEYLKGMVRVARENKGCEFLVFTKMFSVVNEYLDHHRKPKNLQIIFSAWVGQKMDNPHNLPVSHLIFADGKTTAPDGAKFCGGNCTKCFKRKENCWVLKKGESVVLPCH